MSNNDQCFYCTISRGEIRLHKKVNRGALPCITTSKRHQFKRPKRKQKLFVHENQIAFDLAYEDI